MGQATELKGPDLAKGVPSSDLRDDAPLLGHFNGEPVLLVRRAGEVFAVAASCTHYGGPLSEGVVQGETIRCPWHHACFNLRSGDAIAAPALTPLACYRVESKDDRLRVVAKSHGRMTMRSRRDHHPESVVIVGGGAAGHVAAETLRRESYMGSLTLLSADPDPPCDRPNLSKDYLAGNAPEEWIPLRPREFYDEQRIDLVLGARVIAIDPRNRRVIRADGRVHEYEALVLATGATPVTPSVPGVDQPHVFTLRTLAHSRAIIARAKGAKRAVCVGASFIGLEVAASLRARGLEVDVVAPDPPLARAIGPELSGFVQRLHEEHGVRFHIGHTLARIDAASVTLSSGAELAAELVVLGTGVRPNVGLAEAAGLAIDRGVVVDEYLHTSQPGIYAVGDVARWPDPRTNQSIRVEHWAVAERHGQLVARNILGDRTPCRFVPFFWSQHYDVSINYVGHVERWDRVVVDGDLTKRDAAVWYMVGDQALALATVGRDRLSLEHELRLEAT